MSDRITTIIFPLHIHMNHPKLFKVIFLEEGMLNAVLSLCVCGILMNLL